MTSLCTAEARYRADGTPWLYRCDLSTGHDGPHRDHGSHYQWWSFVRPRSCLSRNGVEDACTLPSGHAGWHQDEDNRSRWVPSPTATTSDEPAPSMVDPKGQEPA